MIAGFYANCGHRDRDQTREAALLAEINAGNQAAPAFCARQVAYIVSNASADS